MKPVIGMIPLWDDEKDSIWMLPGYMDGISEAGGHVAKALMALWRRRRDLESF